MLNPRNYKDLKKQKSIKFKKNGEKITADIVVYDTISGKKKTMVEEIKISSFEREKQMAEKNFKRAEQELNDITEIVNDIENCTN